MPVIIIINEAMAAMHGPPPCRAEASAKADRSILHTAAMLTVLLVLPFLSSRGMHSINPGSIFQRLIGDEKREPHAEQIFYHGHASGKWVPARASLGRDDKRDNMKRNSTANRAGVSLPHSTQARKTALQAWCT
ncbi:hypothetical protein [Aquisalinus flavus]|uniref:hypothetical protein n=1 Tax=Aquisalinus flavus TaxID=1526572 RepID=UPI00165FA0DB|nr:hypothetical protein [Aquisalinus flavus]MBD0425873.1 hypothetical protein [Aquisalinus flavus]UNE48530.1 hypothetical protein FF099_10955 [Aquisalinus flavus]